MEIVVRAVLVYLFVLVLLRITTRRIIRSATAADMVLVFVFGGFGIQAVMGDERSATAAVLALVTISLSHLAVHSLSVRFPGFARLSSGSPVVVYADGRWNHARLKSLRVDEADILGEMRQKMIRRLEDIDSVIIEHNGGISIIPREKGG